MQVGPVRIIMNEVVATGNAMELLKDGQIVMIDGSAGTMHQRLTPWRAAPTSMYRGRGQARTRADYLVKLVSFRLGLYADERGQARMGFVSGHLPSSASIFDGARDE